MSLPDDLPIHLIGTQAFLPALLAFIRNLASSTSLPLDHVIFQSVLLCLIAGDKHLILRTPEEDVGLTVKLAVWLLGLLRTLFLSPLDVRYISSPIGLTPPWLALRHLHFSADTKAEKPPTLSVSRDPALSLKHHHEFDTLSCIFNLPTHKLKLRNRTPLRSKNSASSATDPGVFLRSLFLAFGSSSSNSNQTSQDEGSSENVKHLGHHRQYSHVRSSSRHKSKQQPEYPRSRSFPNNLGGGAQDHGTPTSSDVLLMQGTTTGLRSVATTAHPPASPSILKPQPIYPNSLPHAYTDPLPLPSRRKKKLSQSKPLLQLPQALVISGLENASDSTQRSLARVLAERRVVLESQKDASGLEADRGRYARDDEDGVWNLPEGFITVYVCPWNARERPALHKTLLDKFAMSTNVFVSQNIRRDFHLLPFSPAPRPFHPNFVAHSNPGSPSPSYPTSLPPTHTPPVFTKSLPLHKKSSAHFNPPLLPDEVLPRSFIKALRDARHRAHISYTLSLYLSDIFSATRHNSRLDAMLLTAKSMRDAEDLICASRIIGNDLTGMELVRRPGHAQDGDDDDTSDNESTDPISKDYVRLEDEHSTMSAPSRNNNKEVDEQSITAASGVLDVSEVDVARIVPRVISHRVRLRNGPEDEVLSSALFGATFKPHQMPKLPVGSDEGQKIVDKMQSVKAVLVNILSEV